jgi:dihydroxy-acid dehydratase
VKGVLNLLVSSKELSARKVKAPKHQLSGVLEKYAAQVGSAYFGAVTHSGPRGGKTRS